MYHVIIHARPNGGLDYDLRWIEGERCRVAKIEPLATRFDHSFEEVQQRFQDVTRMFLEPDGSFVWVMEDGPHRCQTDGILFDDGQRLVAMEVKSSCDRACLNVLLNALGWPRQRVLFQWVRHGVYLEEDEFRRHVLPSAAE